MRQRLGAVIWGILALTAPACAQALPTVEPTRPSQSPVPDTVLWERSFPKLKVILDKIAVTETIDSEFFKQFGETNVPVLNNEYNSTSYKFVNFKVGVVYHNVVGRPYLYYDTDVDCQIDCAYDLYLHLKEWKWIGKSLISHGNEPIDFEDFKTKAMYNGKLFLDWGGVRIAMLFISGYPPGTTSSLTKENNRLTTVGIHIG
ncbi:MAG: hypothetical protein ACK41P_06665 [Asticcacaulis sp.]